MRHFLLLRPVAAFTVSLAALAAAGPTRAAEESAAPKPTQPNILFILADDVGLEALGCYGGQSYKTPNLDRLADAGMRFDHAYAMPVCHPTRVCLLTGRYPFQAENPRWGSFPKKLEPLTLAHVLKNSGYATAVAGKWQLTLLKKDPQHPERLGFDEWSLFGWHEGPRYYDPLIWQNGKIRKDVSDRYGPDVYTEFLIDFMKRHRDRPFFALYSMALCHDVTDDLKQPVPYAPGKDHYDTYQTMVEAMDRCVGRLVEALDRLRLSENTIVIFTGDNGTPKAYIHRAEGRKYIRKPIHSRLRGQMVPGGKGSLTDGGTRVPLLVRWKGQVKPGQDVDHLVDMSDYLPTFADLARAELPAALKPSGHSFAPLLRGQDYEPRKFAFAEHRGRHWVRNQRYKLYGDGKFYDIERDPRERRPLPAGQLSAEAQAARRQLATALRQLGLNAGKP